MLDVKDMAETLAKLCELAGVKPKKGLEEILAFVERETIEYASVIRKRVTILFGSETEAVQGLIVMLILKMGANLFDSILDGKLNLAKSDPEGSA